MFLLLLIIFPLITLFFFFNDTATTEIYTLSLHDALPISDPRRHRAGTPRGRDGVRLHRLRGSGLVSPARSRSEEHTSELQSRQYLVCRLLLEKKKKTTELEHTSNPVIVQMQCSRIP